MTNDLCILLNKIKRGESVSLLDLRKNSPFWIGIEGNGYSAFR